MGNPPTSNALQQGFVVVAGTQSSRGSQLSGMGVVQAMYQGQQLVGSA